MCTQQAPGQKECDNALRELEVKTLMQSWTKDLGYAAPAITSLRQFHANEHAAKWDWLEYDDRTEEVTLVC